MGLSLWGLRCRRLPLVKFAGLLPCNSVLDRCVVVGSRISAAVADDEDTYLAGQQVVSGRVSRVGGR